MPKIHYDLLAPEANKLIIKMSLATDQATAEYWWDEYVSLLKISGWSVEEFDLELIKRIDQNWIDKKDIDWN
jgi:hypothetical protein